MLPLLLPRIVTMITGSPVSRRVLALVPPDASYCSTWSRTHWARLGMYSPCKVMTPPYGPRSRATVPRMANKTFELGRVGIWTGVLDAVPSSEARAIAGRLEELGFPTLWIPETVGRDPFVTATRLLDATSTLKIATGI